MVYTSIRIILKKSIVVTILVICGLVSGMGQRPIRLLNPSFEDIPRASIPPEHWASCENFLGESPPDVHPSGHFNVTKAPYDGESYLGMVARSNETWENVFQRLAIPFEEDQCYAFSIFLARSTKYLSPVRGSDDLKSYEDPIVFKIWGGFDGCDKSEILAESKLVQNTEWEEYVFKIKPSRPYKYVIFEAFYKTPCLFPYNGNILLDKASPFVPIDCDLNPEGMMLSENKRPLISFIHPHVKSQKQDNLRYVKAKVENARRNEIVVSFNNERVEDFEFDLFEERLSMALPLRVGQNIVTIEARNDAGSSVEKTHLYYGRPTYPEPDVASSLTTDQGGGVESTDQRLDVDDLGLSKAKVGETIVVKNLFFKADTSSIEPSSFAILNKLSEVIKKNPKIKIEIAGHTNGRPTSHEFCDELSTKRARSVYEYMQDRGVPSSQMTYKGYGKRKPIATNATREGRIKNQRVEIKVLEVG